MNKCDHIVGISYSYGNLINSRISSKEEPDEIDVLYKFCPECGEKLKGDENV